MEFLADERRGALQRRARGSICALLGYRPMHAKYAGKPQPLRRDHWGLVMDCALKYWTGARSRSGRHERARGPLQRVGCWAAWKTAHERSA